MLVLQPPAPQDDTEEQQIKKQPFASVEKVSIKIISYIVFMNTNYQRDLASILLDRFLLYE